MLKTAKKANAGPTDRPTDRQTDRQTDIVPYRVALHVTKNSRRSDLQKTALQIYLTWTDSKKSFFSPRAGEL